MYEITNWEGLYLNECSDISKITLNSFVLDENILRLANGEIDDDVIDVEFKVKDKLFDNLDFGFAVFSGLVSSILYRKFRVKKEFNEEDLKKIKVEDLLTKVAEITENDYKDLKKDINNYFSMANEDINHLNDSKEVLKDLVSSFTIDSLVFSIIDAYYGFHIYKNENGHFVFEKDEDFVEKEWYLKIIDGVIDWLFEQAHQYAKNGKLKKEYSKLGLKKQLSRLENLIKNLSKAIYQNSADKFDKKALKEWFLKYVHFDNDNLKKDLGSNEFSIKLNILLVYSYVYIKNFIKEVKKHEVHSIEGLNLIDFSRIDNTRLIARLNTISTGIYAAIDVAFASVENFEVLKNAENPLAYLRVVADINWGNGRHLTVVISEDLRYIIEDIKEVFNKAKVVEIKKRKEISADKIQYCLGLNKVETKILYSLELDMIKEDIQNTKKSDDQLLKNEWKNEWIKAIEASIDQNRIFDEDSNKIYQMLEVRKSTEKDNLWLYIIAMELSLFKPYYPISEDVNKYKKLKLSGFNYLENIFCTKQKYIIYKEMQEIQKCYKKEISYLNNSTLKTGAAAAGAVVLGAATGGAAYFFAPQIAVTLFGGAFPALHGAALISASMAAAGGGAIAVGGLGMAGGTLVIAGGGTLLGIGASTASSVLLLNSSKFVQTDLAKILTKCEYIMLNKLNKKEEVVLFQIKLEELLYNYMLRLEFLNSLDNTKETKDAIKEAKKSVEYLNRANTALIKLTKKG